MSRLRYIHPTDAECVPCAVCKMPCWFDEMGFAVHCADHSGAGEMSCRRTSLTPLKKRPSLIGRIGRWL